MIAIVDYGMGNLMSLSNALKKLNIEFFFVENRLVDKEFSHIILPGVGAYSAAIDEIKKRDLDIFLIEKREEYTYSRDLSWYANIIKNWNRK